MVETSPAEKTAASLTKPQQDYAKTFFPEYCKELSNSGVEGCNAWLKTTAAEIFSSDVFTYVRAAPFTTHDPMLDQATTDVRGRTLIAPSTPPFENFVAETSRHNILSATEKHLILVTATFHEHFDLKTSQRYKWNVSGTSRQHLSNPVLKNAQVFVLPTVLKNPTLMSNAEVVGLVEYFMAQDTPGPDDIPDPDDNPGADDILGPEDIPGPKDIPSPVGGKKKAAPKKRTGGKKVQAKKPVGATAKDDSAPSP
ncbi:hypothetical protein B0H19DRAFT_1063376 [Mycena capillaripes]|nr:hypothetical protein B0H19DRAFT_1063376 [Mycena capillaripes]